MAATAQVAPTRLPAAVAAPGMPAAMLWAVLGADGGLHRRLLPGPLLVGVARRAPTAAGVGGSAGAPRAAPVDTRVLGPSVPLAMKRAIARA